MSTYRRMRRDRMQTMYVKSRAVEKDNEGGTFETYPGEAVKIKGEQWPASGKVQAQMYGERLAYIRNVKIVGKYQQIVTDGKIGYQFADGTIVYELDGICIDVPGTEDPDYKIISIKPHKPLFLEVEKR